MWCHFRHRPRQLMTDQKVGLYLSFTLDDSYTPSTLCLRAGTSLSDLQDVKVLSLDKPNGWVTFDVSAELSEDGQELYVHKRRISSREIDVVSLVLFGPLQQANLLLCSANHNPCKPYERERHPCARTAHLRATGVSAIYALLIYTTLIPCTFLMPTAL